MDPAEFRRLPLMGILRGIGESAIEPLTETVISAGLKTIEIAMNTPGAAGLIKKMIAAADNRICVGAGTVLDMNTLRSALDSGATFIVMPVLVDDVMEYCVKNSIPVFPGAFTPQEIYNAWSSGATMVKVFPAKFFGPAYFKEVKGPFGDIELLACGGVTPENFREFIKSGASAAAFGESVFRKDYIKEGSFDKIGASVSALVKAALT